MDLFSTRVAYAAPSTDFKGFLTNVDEMIVNPLIALLFALAILYFLYGVFKFISNQDNEEAKTDGRQHMIWGVIGIVIMMGVWAILGIIVSTLGLSGQIDPKESKVELNP